MHRNKDWEEPLAEGTVALIVKRRLHEFQGFQGSVGLSDLISEVMLHVRAAWPKYNPKWAKTTYVGMITNRRLTDILRKLTNHSGYEAAVAIRRDATVEPFENEPIAIGQDDLVEWTGGIYRTMRQIFTQMKIPLRAEKARIGYPDRAQRSTLLLLKKRLGLSSRRLETKLRKEPALRAAIQLGYTPSSSTLRRLEKSGAHIPGMTPRVESALANVA